MTPRIAALAFATVFTPAFLVQANPAEPDVVRRSFLRWHWFADETHLAIDGYDPVAYHTLGAALPGRDDLAFEHEGLTYFFSDEDTLCRFRKAPERYLPAFGGWCALGLGLDPEALGKPQARRAPDPTSFKLVDGRLLLFAKGPCWDARSVWDCLDEQELLERAESFWQERNELVAQLGPCPVGFNPNAPLETAQLDFLIGGWDTSYVVRLDPSSDLTMTLSGEWTAWYDRAGYAIYHDWVQRNAPPNVAGPAIRSFDATLREWVLDSPPNAAPAQAAWNMIGRFDDRGTLHGTTPLEDVLGRAYVERTRFREIRDTGFRWHTDRSYDGGRTWILDWCVGHSTRKVQTF